MRRTLATLLLVSVVAAPAALSAAGVVAPVTVGAAATATADHDEANRSSGDARITYVSMAGRGTVGDQEELVADHPGPPYVWASEPLTLRPTVQTESTNRTAMACAELLDAERAVVDEVGCRTWNSTSRERYARIEMSEWPSGSRGTHLVRFELLTAAADGSESTGNDTDWVLRDSREAEAYVISKQGDLDDDGISNAREVELGTDFTRRDTDGDGVSDSAEVYQYGSDPLAADTTDDGFEDGTVASINLPPTVPHLVPAVAVAALLGVAAVAAGGVKLRRALRAGSAPADGCSETASALEPADGADLGPGTKENEILAVLRRHDGRMRQTDLVDETEWSKATVSRLLSTLEDEGRVEKIRVGRGNVVRLVGPGATFDDERSQASG